MATTKPPSAAQAAKLLSAAMGQDDLKSFKRLATIHPDGARHWKPIMDAAFAGKAQFVYALLAAGADPDVVAGNPARHTPLVRIAQHHSTIPKHDGHYATLETLLNAGADPDLGAGPHHLPPLSYACIGGNERMLAILDAAGATTDLHIAAMRYDTRRLKRMIKQHGVNSCDREGRTALHALAFSGLWRLSAVHEQQSHDCLQLLLDAGADVELAQMMVEGDETFPATPLWRAISWQNNTRLVDLLLAAGARPGAAVFAASHGGNEAICAMLDAHGADWNQTFHGKTPLLDLVNYKKTKLLPWLIRHGAQINATDNEGRTALHYAAMTGVRADVVAELLANGAKIVSDKSGTTPLQLAQSKARDKLIPLLKSVD